MRNTVETPNFTQAAEMMPPGPDRDFIFARCEEIFDRRGGNSRARSLRVLELTRDAYARWLEQVAKNPETKPVVGAREGLRATMAIDKACEKLEALRNECFRQAMEEFFRQRGYRACVPAWKGEFADMGATAKGFMDGLIREVARVEAAVRKASNAKNPKVNTEVNTEAETEAAQSEPETITLGSTRAKVESHPESDESGMVASPQEANATTRP